MPKRKDIETDSEDTSGTDSESRYGHKYCEDFGQAYICVVCRKHGRLSKISCDKPRCVLCWHKECRILDYNPNYSYCANKEAKKRGIDIMSINSTNIERLLGLSSLTRVAHMTANRRHIEVPDEEQPEESLESKIADLEREISRLNGRNAYLSAENDKLRETLLKLRHDIMKASMNV